MRHPISAALTKGIVIENSIVKHTQYGIRSIGGMS